MNSSSVRVSNANLTIPTLENAPEGYHSPYITSKHVRMKHHHSQTLHRIVAGLMATGAKTAEGKTVHNAATAICWILEQIDAQMPAVTIPVSVISPAAPSAEKISRGEKIENENLKNENSKISELEI